MLTEQIETKHLRDLEKKKDEEKKSEEKSSDEKATEEKASSEEKKDKEEAKGTSEVEQEVEAKAAQAACAKGLKCDPKKKEAEEEAAEKKAKEESNTKQKKEFKKAKEAANESLSKAKEAVEKTKEDLEKHKVSLAKAKKLKPLKCDDAATGLQLALQLSQLTCRKSDWRTPSGATGAAPKPAAKKEESSLWPSRRAI